jgi:hypothetical protein
MTGYAQNFIKEVLIQLAVIEDLIGRCMVEDEPFNVGKLIQDRLAVCVHSLLRCRLERID